MKEFGWTIRETLSLTFPVFLYLTIIVSRIRADDAIDSFFEPYVAAKCAGEPLRILTKKRGSFYLHPESKQEVITAEMIEHARNRLHSIIAANEQRLKHSVI